MPLAVHLAPERSNVKRRTFLSFDPSTSRDVAEAHSLQYATTLSFNLYTV